MSPALRFLLRALFRGRLRYTARRMRTVKGALTTVLAVALMAVIVGGQIFLHGHAGTPGHDTLVRYTTRMLLVFLLLNVVNARGLYLAPQEIDFLLPAPLGRRQLLGYLLVSRFQTQLFTSVWVAMYAVPNAPLALAASAAVLLGLAFVFSVGVLVALLRIALSFRLGAAARTRLRRALWVGVGVGGVLLWRRTPADADAFDRVGALLDSGPVRVLALPTLPFARLLAARDALEALGWGVASLATLALVVGAVFALNVPWEERSIELSRTLQERLDRVRSGRGFWETARRGEGPVRPARVPALRFLGRAAPLARRHLLELAHNPRMLIPLLLMNVWLGVVFGMGPAMRAMREGGGLHFSRTAAAGLLAAVMAGPIFTTVQLRLDFRRDLDRMPFLKSLPLSPLAVAAGQIFTVALVFTGLEFVLVGAVAALTRVLPALWVGGALLVVPVLIWCLVALDNTLFLLLPSRPPVPGAGAGAFNGRTIGSGFVKYLALALIAGLSGALGLGLAWAFSSPVAGGVGVMAGLVGFAVLLTWTTGRAFAAFDVGRDVP